MNTIRWYKIGKLLLHTQKEKHSNGLEDRPSFCQADKGALLKNQDNYDNLRAGESTNP